MARALIEGMGTAPRGPKRDGVFAVWLVVRLVEDLGAEPPYPARAAKRRLDLLTRRLGSLSMPPVLRRAIGTSLRALDGAGVEDGPRILEIIAGPAAETLGRHIGDALRRGCS